MEIVYQAVPYCGIARVFDIIYDTNEVLEANGGKWQTGHRFSSNATDIEMETWTDSL